MNLSTEIIFLIAGAVLGTVLSIFTPLIYEKLRQRSIRRNRQARQQLLESGNSYDWLIEYYQRRDALRDLYDCRMGGYEAKVPFLTRPEWNPLGRDLLAGEEFIQFIDSDTSKFPVDDGLIKRRILLNQTLFDEPTLYLDRFEPRPDGFRLHIKCCRYFQMFTLLAQLEEETFQAIRRHRFNRTRLRDQICPDLDTAVRVLKKPSSIGCQVAVAVRNHGSYELLVQTRSHATITYGGAKSLIPVFGLSPVIGAPAPDQILFYNFIKEFCEELFDYDELITITKNKRVEPYWFFELPEARELLALIKKKKLRFEYLGFGFDALNGSSTISLLAVIDDPRYVTRLKQKIAANWEVAERTYNQEPVEFVDYRSPKFEEWLRGKKYQFPSAFAISQAIRRLEQLDAQPRLAPAGETPGEIGTSPRDRSN